MQDSSGAELAASPGRPRAQEKPKSAHRSSQPLRTEWSIAALTPRISKTPRESGAQQVPALGLAPDEATEAACADSAPAAHSAQHDRGASLAPHGRDGELAGPSLQREGQSSRAASKAQGSSNPHSSALPSSAAQHSGQQQRQGGEDSCGRGDAQPDRDSLEPQLPGSSPSQTQPSEVVNRQFLASLPVQRNPLAGSQHLKPRQLELEGDTEDARMEGSLPSSRQAPVHSPAQHGRHGSSKSPSKQPTTSHFSIHVDSRAHVHRYSAAPPARTDSAAANEPALHQVCPHRPIA